MRSMTMAVAALVLAGCAQILGLDEPTAFTDAAVVDAPPGTPDAPGSPADAGIDAAACTGDTDVSSNPDHCGRCDHACGGGTCVQGECQPVEVARNLTGLKKIAVSDTAIYWTEASRVATCPLPQGCVLAPRSVADPYDRLGPIAVRGDRVFFAGCATGADSCDDRHRFYECPSSGCPQMPPSMINTDITFDSVVLGPTHAYLFVNGYGVYGCDLANCAGTDALWRDTVFGIEIAGMAVDQTSVYVRGGGDLRTCPEATGCASPAIAGGTSSITAPFAVHGGRAFWALQTGGGFRVQHCTVASCTVANLANETPGVTEIQVDDTGVYWINSTAMTIRHCPLDGCPPGGATYVARDLASPVNLTLGPGFVYYTSGGSIFKVAKP